MLLRDGGNLSVAGRMDGRPHGAVLPVGTAAGEVGADLTNGSRHLLVTVNPCWLP